MYFLNSIAAKSVILSQLCKYDITLSKTMKLKFLIEDNEFSNSPWMLRAEVTHIN